MHGRMAVFWLPKHLAVELQTNSVFAVPYSRNPATFHEDESIIEFSNVQEKSENIGYILGLSRALLIENIQRKKT